VKALFAFDHYGVLHHWVRLRWGFLDETLPVDWAVPGDPNLYETLQACHAARRPIDVVWGSAPGWSDLWSRARRVTIVSFDVWCLVVEGDGQRWQLPRVEIQAARPSAETPDDDAAARQCESKPPSVEVSR
jgi:hypothetical protein